MRWITMAVAGLLLTAQHSFAQTIDGLLIDDESGAPVAAGAVTLLSADSVEVASVLTDGEGRFIITAPDPGRYRLRAERIGYRTSVSPPIELSEDDTVRVEYRISTQAVVLRPITVVGTARVPSGQIAEFYERAERGGFGSYITREEIERAQPFYASDLLRRIPGVRLFPSTFGYVAVMSRSRCLPQIFVDGVRVFAASIDELVHPIDLEGVEVYRGSAGVPGELMGMNTACGTIALWTRRGP